MTGKKENRTIIRIWTSPACKQHKTPTVSHISIETKSRYMSFWSVPFSAEQILQYCSLCSQVRRSEKKAPAWEDVLRNNLLAKARIAKEKFELDYQNYIESIRSDFFNDYQKDFVSERHVVPSQAICFFSLNMAAIENQFDHIMKNPLCWQPIGRDQYIQELSAFAKPVKLLINNFFLHPETDVRRESCDSITLQILAAGGIKSLFHPLSSQGSIGFKNGFSIHLFSLMDIITCAKHNEIYKFPDTWNFSVAGETEFEQAMVNYTSRCCSIM